MTTLAELIGTPVHQGGRRIGYVGDLRAEVCPITEDTGDQGEGAGLVIVGVLVTQQVRANFMGYERTEVDAPWLLARLFRWLNRRTVLVDWADVEALDDEGLRIGVDASISSPELPVSGASNR